VPGRSAYSHYCSFLTGWTAQKRTRLVAKESASVRMSVLRAMRAFGITAPPLRVELSGFSLWCLVLQVAAASAQRALTRLVPAGFAPAAGPPRHAYPNPGVPAAAHHPRNPIVVHLLFLTVIRGRQRPGSIVLATTPPRSRRPSPVLPLGRPWGIGRVHSQARPLCR
jgi:hypothetical protein